MKFPELLDELHQLEFDYADGEGIDFEPHPEFQSAEETADWIRAWTRNLDLDGAEFRVFGQDGTGGVAAFWLVRDGAPIEEQPIVFFGSEGELGVIARSLDDYLWLLAGNLGPYEAVSDPDFERAANHAFTEFAERHAPKAKKPPSQVIAEARAEFPGFEEKIRALCG